jgi:hypothetical protein
MKAGVTALAIFALGSAVAGCYSDKGEAERAIERADRMVAAMRDRAVKVVPVETKALLDSVQAAKDKFAAKEYLAALNTARASQGRAIELANSLTGKSTQLSSKFMAFSGNLNETVDRIRRRLAAGPPPGVDRAAFEALQADVPKWDDSWRAATKEFQSGDFGSANARADSLKAKIAAANALLKIPEPKP